MSFLVGFGLGALVMFLVGLPKIKAELRKEFSALMADLLAKTPRP